MRNPVYTIILLICGSACLFMFYACGTEHESASRPKVTDRSLNLCQVGSAAFVSGTGNTPLRIRKSPSLSSPVVAHVGEGTSLQILSIEQNGDLHSHNQSATLSRVWYEVVGHKVNGFGSSLYFSCEAPASNNVERWVKDITPPKATYPSTTCSKMQHEIYQIDCPTRNRYSASSRTAYKRIILHNTEGGFSQTINWFQNSKSKASSNAVIARDGTIARMVEEQYPAWTTSRDKFGVPNDFNALTIELEGGIASYGSYHEPYLSKIQHTALLRTIRYWMNKYGIKAENIIPHVHAVQGTAWFKYCPWGLWSPGDEKAVEQEFFAWRKAVFGI